MGSFGAVSISFDPTDTELVFSVIATSLKYVSSTLNGTNGLDDP